MEPKDIYRWLNSVPLIPFRISMSNGRTYDVHKPEFVMQGKTTLILGEPDPDFPIPVFETAEFLSLMHINSISPLSLVNPPVVA